MRKNKTKRKTKEKRNGSRDKREKCPRTSPLGGEVKAETSSLGFFREHYILNSFLSYLVRTK